MTRVGFLDPRPLLRAGLGNLLRSMGFDDVQEAADLAQLGDPASGRSKPDLLLVKLSPEIGDVADFMKAVRAWAPEANVVFLAGSFDLEVLGACFAAGARGCVSENISREALYESLRLVSAGGSVFPEELTTMIASLAAASAPSQGDRTEGLHGLLSGREIEIVRCLARGEPNKVIAQKLGIAETTVKVHVKRILRKTPFSNRTQVALWAVTRDLMEGQQPADLKQ